MDCFQILLEAVTWKVQEAQGRSAFFLGVGGEWGCGGFAALLIQAE